MTTQHRVIISHPARKTGHGPFTKGNHEQLRQRKRQSLPQLILGFDRLLPEGPEDPVATRGRRRIRGLLGIEADGNFTPPGPYRVAVGVYDPQEGARVPAVDAAGQRWADDAAILLTVEP